MLYRHQWYVLCCVIGAVVVAAVFTRGMAVLITVGIPSILLMVLVVPPLWLEFQRTRTHVRLISARIDHRWETPDGTLNHTPEHGILLGADLAVVNAGRRPVRNVVLEQPAQLYGRTIKRLGPGERYTLHLPPPLAAHLDTEPSITMRLEDTHGKRWRWSPTDDTLSPSSPRTTPLAFLVQASADTWPQTWRDRFGRLPAPAQRILWGYLPATG